MLDNLLTLDDFCDIFQRRIDKVRMEISVLKLFSDYTNLLWKITVNRFAAVIFVYVALRVLILTPISLTLGIDSSFPNKMKILLQK